MTTRQSRSYGHPGYCGAAAPSARRKFRVSRGGACRTSVTRGGCYLVSVSRRSRNVMASSAVLVVGIAVLVALVATYWLCPRAWARILIAVERSRSGVRSRSLIVDGRRFAYWEGGAGRDGHAARLWRRQDHWTRAARHLGRRFRLVALDLPGFGARRPILRSRSTCAARPARIRAFIVALGIQRFISSATREAGTSPACSRMTSRRRAQLDAGRDARRSLRRSRAWSTSRSRAVAPAGARQRARVRAARRAGIRSPPFIPGAVLRALCADALASRPLRLRIWADLVGANHYLLESLLPRLTLRR